MKNIKSIGMFLFNGLALLGSIITIVLSFQNTSATYRNIWCTFEIIYIAVLLFYIIKRVIEIVKEELRTAKVYDDYQLGVAIKSHSYFHNLRDYSSDVYSIKSLKIENVRDKCRGICDYLSEFYKQVFSKYLGEYSVSVCIKLIKTDKIFNEDYNSWEMETIARSASTVQERVKADSAFVKIVDNSDFQVIISSDYDDDLFSFADMRSIGDDFLKTYKMEYKNSRGEKFLDFYKSTIVVPIRINGKYISKELKSIMKNPKDRSLILGFLCIDSLKVFETQEEKKIFSVGVEYAKSMGDSLYLFFEKIMMCSLKSNGNITTDDRKIYSKPSYHSRKRKGAYYENN